MEKNTERDIWAGTVIVRYEGEGMMESRRKKVKEIRMRANRW